MGHHPISSKEGLALVDQVRKLAMRLPEVSEQVDAFGHTSFRVSDKPFVMLGEGGEEGPSLSIKTLPITQEHLLQRQHFYKTPYIGQHGWVSILGKNVADWKEIESYLLEGYLRSAPKRLAKLVQTT
ncbi:phosphoribosylglycinamide formyltransferase [Brevibacillus choshinensis]|uniref:Phosphoribosylglycinamide formyltransferase n=1 Tax=Brevibacillus choshinensis TaxID=54911 RepID=A0ABR5MZP9_BRECH|nr:MmcQ/YjbR family DNA-binding protein [Brevibacillus choshinensis]KQL43578.1 phosphoribosylglycinamide formyltransferase [Brevibacillus choshinensis]